MAALLKHTVKPAGGDFTTLDACIDHLVAAHANFVTADVYGEVEISGDWSAGADTAAVTITGLTLDATRYLFIYTDEANWAHADGWDTTRYQLSVSNAVAVLAQDDYVIFDGLQVQVPAGNANGQDCFYFNAIAANNAIDIRNCRVRLAVGATRTSYCIHAADADLDLRVWNTICEVHSGNAGTARGIYGEVGHIDVYNSLVYGFNRGISSVTASVDTYDSTVFNNIDDFYNSGGAGTIDHCASDDGDGTNHMHATGGDWDNDFTNDGGGDFTLLATSALIDAAAASGAGIFSTDIDGTLRGPYWDIGPYEWYEPEASASASASYEESGSASGIVEDHELTVDNMTLALNFGEPTLTQAQTLSVANMALALNHAGVALTQAQTIAVANMEMWLALDGKGLDLVQDNILAVDDVAMALNLEALALAQAQTLTIADIALALGFEAPVLTQVQLLSIDGMAMASVFGEPTVTQAQTLAVANMAHGLNFDSPALIQVQTLAVDNMVCALVFGEPTLMAGTVLVVNDMALGLAFGDPALTQDHSLSVEDMSLALVFDALGLTQAQVLAVDDMTLALLFDSITLPGTVPVVPGAGTDCATWASRDRCGLLGPKIRYLGKKCIVIGPKCRPVGPKCGPVGPKPKRCPDD